MRLLPAASPRRRRSGERRSWCRFRRAINPSILSTRIDSEAESRQARGVDLKNRFVLRGLMDMHVHLMVNGLDFVSFVTKGEADATVVTAAMAKKTLMAGFTTV